MRVHAVHQSYTRTREVFTVLISQVHKLETGLESLVRTNFAKFPEILQNLFYLLGHSKQEINLHGTNVLDWRRSKGATNQP